MIKRAFAIPLLLCTLSLGCDAVAQSPKFCKKHLQISEAKQEKWNPGIVKKNSDQAGGIIYSLKIKVRKSGYVTFEKLIIDGQALDVEVIQNGTRDVQGPFQKGDEITLKARSDKKHEIVKADESIVKKLTEKHSVAAILYQIKNKQYYQTLQGFATAEGDRLIE
jgi:hypothetical protein